MNTRQNRDRAGLRCEQLEDRVAPSATWLAQNFDQLPIGTLPVNWSQWTNQSATSFATASGRAFTGPTSLATDGTSNLAARTWYGEIMPANFGVSAYVYLNSLQPVQLFVRGRNPNTNAPTYYALSIVRGLQAQLLRVMDGNKTVLGSIRSSAYFSGQWARITLKPTGNQLSVEIVRADTGQYLNAAGTWQASATTAILVSDSSIPGDGCSGINRPAQYADRVTLDDVNIIGPDNRQNFDTSPLNALPGGWSRWTNAPSGSFAVSNLNAVSLANCLASTAITSQVTARAWLDAPVPENVQVSAAVYLNSLVPAEVIARGRGLNTAAPTFYALSVTRGLEVKLLRVVNGTSTELGSLRSASYLSDRWVRVSLIVNGNRIQALVRRQDTGQYLNASGAWQSGSTRAVDVSDNVIRGIGQVGVERSRIYAGTVTLDDFEVVSAAGDTAAPVVTITNPGAGTILSGTVTVQATATDAGGIEHVEFLIDGVLRYATSRAPYNWRLDSSGLANGLHTLTVKAYDAAGNVGQAAINCTARNNTVSLPNIPRHYRHIRIAELAYTGTPFTSFEQQLLQNSVDLVIPNPRYLAQINGLAPNTPQLIYTNVSNLYEQLYTDWITYADQHNLDREAAFYHAARATTWTGASASSQPVSWFWSVRRGANLTVLTNLTSAAHDSATGDVTFGALGESIYIGFPERFRALNVNLFRAAAGGWNGLIEYASAVDANGNPTAWRSLSLLSDATAGFTRSGAITFDPPADWKTASLSGSAPFYFVRVRTTAAGTAPIATTLLGRDYVAANGTTQGTIPAFDQNADTNNDGYLNDAEFARRAAGNDARFDYESRVFYPFYGQMRFATNPSSPDVQQWAADYQFRFLAANALADGLFVDNSGGRSPLNGYSLEESAANYSEDYGTLLAAINRRIAPRWVAANTSGGGAETDAVIRNTPASVEEFALRPLAANRQQFEDLAAMIRRRQLLTAPASYMVLDSLPTGGSPTDPRTQIATLAYYYLLGDPETTFLMFFGGNDPNSSWRQHWSPAAAYDVGPPLGNWSVFAQGIDPTNVNLTYKIYQREYGNALVLYKPLSYAQGRGNGTLADATATTHALNGSYRILNADGTLSAPITRVTLRNGEGAILVRA